MSDTTRPSAAKASRDPSRRESRRTTELFARVESVLRERVASWDSLDVADPARAIAEALAQELASVEARLEARTDEAVASAFDELEGGAEAPRSRRVVVVFDPHPARTQPVRVPRGTVLTRERDDGRDPGLHFETLHEAWTSAAQLECALVVEGDSIRALPVAGDASISQGPVTLFRRDTRSRRLYLGDELFGLLAWRGEVVLEWPGLAPEIADGIFEYSTGDAWRLVPLEVSVVEDPDGVTSLRTRIRGPLPDLTATRVGETELPFLRWTAAGELSAAVEIGRPSIVWGPRLEDDAFPRPLARVLVERDGALLDRSHRGSSGLLSFAGAEPEEDPCVWLGFTAPTSTSLYWAAVGATSIGDDARLAWEYSTASGFAPLRVADDSAGLTRSGTISWRGPEDWRTAEVYGRRLAWVRARWISGSFAATAAVRVIHPHAVEAIEGRRVDSREIVLVRRGRLYEARGLESDTVAFEALGLKTASGGLERFERVLRAGRLSPGEFRWRRMETGRILIEIAGHRGLVENEERIEAIVPELRAGLVSGEELPAGTLTVTDRPVDGVVGVRQPEGSFGESWSRPALDPGVLAARWLAGDRAVTAEDIRVLALAFDSGLARVEIAMDPTRPWEVWVVVIGRPHGDGRSILGVSARRLEALRAFLSSRVPIGTVVRVIEPREIPFTIEVPETVSKARVDVLRARIEEWLHPLTGGPEGGGTPLGKGLRSIGLETIMAPREREGLVLALVPGRSGASSRGEHERRPASAIDLESDVVSLHLPIGLAKLVGVRRVLAGSLQLARASSEESGISPEEISAEEISAEGISADRPRGEVPADADGETASLTGASSTGAVSGRSHESRSRRTATPGSSLTASASPARTTPHGTAPRNPASPRNPATPGSQTKIVDDEAVRPSLRTKDEASGRDPS